MTITAEERLACLLADLRRSGRQQSGLSPDLVPPDRDSAYRVARMVADALGWRRRGWKIAATNPVMQQALRTQSPIYGRVFEPFILSSPVGLRRASLLHPIAECEYMVTLATDLPPRSDAYSMAEVADAVAAISPGVEVAECRFVHDAAFPPLSAILADGSASGRLVMGAPIADWRHRNIPSEPIVLRVNGAARRQGTAGEALADHPLVPLTWLANELSRTGIGLRAGEVVSTGTCTGMILARPGDRMVADFGAFGRVSVDFDV